MTVSREKMADAFATHINNPLTPSQVIAFTRSCTKQQRVSDVARKPNKRQVNFNNRKCSRLEAADGEDASTKDVSLRKSNKESSTRSNQKRKKKILPQSKSSELMPKDNPNNSTKNVKPKMVGNAPDIYWYVSLWSDHSYFYFKFAHLQLNNIGELFQCNICAFIHILILYHPHLKYFI